MSSHPGLAPAALNSSGAGQCRISHNKSGIIWRISQMAIGCVPSASMSLMTKFNANPLMTPVTVLSGTAAHGLPAIDIGDHDVITVDVTNGPPNGNVTLSYYYEEIPA